jgi:hypothetical protein
MLTLLKTWIEGTWLHTAMVQSPVAFTLAETLHFMGLSILIGALVLIDLRGLGLMKRLPLLEMHKLVPFALAGFAINLLTGLAFIFSSPGAYFDNLGFQLKMGLIVLAGVNALAFEFLVFRPLVAGDAGAATGPAVRITSGLSLALWAGVLIFGRLIPYF